MVQLAASFAAPGASFEAASRRLRTRESLYGHGKSAAKILKYLRRVNLCAARWLSAAAGDLLGRIGESLAAQDDVGFARILCPVVAHAFDAGHEQHCRRKFSREDLRIVP